MRLGWISDFRFLILITCPFFLTPYPLHLTPLSLLFMIAAATA
jgi:hypothetical protein